MFLTTFACPTRFSFIFNLDLHLFLVWSSHLARTRLAFGWDCQRTLTRVWSRTSLQSLCKLSCDCARISYQTWSRAFRACKEPRLLKRSKLPANEDKARRPLVSLAGQRWSRLLIQPRDRTIFFLVLASATQSAELELPHTRIFRSIYFSIFTVPFLNTISLWSLRKTSRSPFRKFRCFLTAFGTVAWNLRVTFEAPSDSNGAHPEEAK